MKNEINRAQRAKKLTKLLSVIATATMMLTAVSCGQKKDVANGEAPVFTQVVR